MTFLARCLVRMGAAALFVTLCACSVQNTESAQPAPAAPKAKAAQHTKKTAKAEPTQQELFDYVRGKLLALSPNDGINDNLEVTFDAAKSVLSVTQPDGRCDIDLGTIDTNSLIWEVFDPSDTYHSRPQVLRVTLTSLSGKRARTCYDTHNVVDTSVNPNRARLLFSLAKTNAVSNFQENMNKAIKKLITLSGGAPEKDLF
jgi:hypothetical protein